ncbi:MAG TPA: DUF1648 domain-containing protein [Candidatus Acidoferrales bacterium]|nr:DUF1648 domain-containing protein [Candidatus Acidoferrales bacterium]
MTKLTAVRTSTIPVIALLAVAALQIAYYYPRLPALVASHFDVSGMPNRYEPKATFLVLYVGVLVGLAVVYVVIPRLMLALPVEYINLPNKAYWLAPERREATVAFFMDRFTIFGAATLALIVLVFQLGFTANLSTQTFPSTTAFWLLGAYGAFAVGWLATMVLRFSRV